MPAFISRTPRLALALVCAGAAASGCSSFDRMSYGVANVVTPYRVEIVQGNFVSKEQAAALRPGMNRQQVRDILGTPLVTSVFHANRWDYVFTIKRQGVEPQARKLTVYFKGDAMDRFEGDEMPSEAEFVATLDNKRKNARVPVLEASEESLRKYAPANPPAAVSGPQAAPPLTAYPPLEAPTR
ncbi:outer membrane protein assembly factor BamE [Caenimonas sp. SL110]|uniref:outer membrane protein assembly factor BamE n=1 Tax=Caenimonas sp. SL110 TaxID=1450524 RepID=UPI000654BB5A|nr:outer membrane protein assembly factor BamE [Caenimonas sp. SL110]